MPRPGSARKKCSGKTGAVSRKYPEKVQREERMPCPGSTRKKCSGKNGCRVPEVPGKGAAGCCVWHFCEIAVPQEIMVDCAGNVYRQYDPGLAIRKDA